jgi:hypothetical protein
MNTLDERDGNRKRLVVVSLFPLLSSIRKDMTCQCHIPALSPNISRVRVDRSILSFLHLCNLQLIQETKKEQEVRVCFSYIVLIYK